MEFTCPTCHKPLEHHGETAHCVTCDKDFTIGHVALTAISRYRC